MPTLTLTRAVAALHGVAPSELQGSTLSAAAVRALTPLLESAGFDVTQDIHVRELPESQGFRLTQ
jgi:hypothetical protein